MNYFNSGSTTERNAIPPLYTSKIARSVTSRYHNQQIYCTSEVRRFEKIQEDTRGNLRRSDKLQSVGDRKSKNFTPGRSQKLITNGQNWPVDLLLISYFWYSGVGQPQDIIFPSIFIQHVERVNNRKHLCIVKRSVLFRLKMQKVIVFCFFFFLRVFPLKVNGKPWDRGCFRETKECVTRGMMGYEGGAHKQRDSFFK